MKISLQPRVSISEMLINIRLPNLLPPSRYESASFFSPGSFFFQNPVVFPAITVSLDRVLLQKSLLLKDLRSLPCRKHWQAICSLKEAAVAALTAPLMRAVQHPASHLCLVQGRAGRR